MDRHPAAVDGLRAAASMCGGAGARGSVCRAEGEVSGSSAGSSGVHNACGGEGSLGGFASAGRSGGAVYFEEQCTGGDRAACLVGGCFGGVAGDAGGVVGEAARSAEERALCELRVRPARDAGALSGVREAHFEREVRVLGCTVFAGRGI
jgi:hypothetical protein